MHRILLTEGYLDKVIPEPSPLLNRIKSQLFSNPIKSETLTEEQFKDKLQEVPSYKYCFIRLSDHDRMLLALEGRYLIRAYTDEYLDGLKGDQEKVRRFITTHTPVNLEELRGIKTDDLDDVNLFFIVYHRKHLFTRLMARFKNRPRDQNLAVLCFFAHKLGGTGFIGGNKTSPLDLIDQDTKYLFYPHIPNHNLYNILYAWVVTGWSVEKFNKYTKVTGDWKTLANGYTSPDPELTNLVRFYAMYKNGGQ